MVAAPAVGWKRSRRRLYSRPRPLERLREGAERTPPPLLERDGAERMLGTLEREGLDIEPPLLRLGADRIAGELDRERDGALMDGARLGAREGDMLGPLERDGALGAERTLRSTRLADDEGKLERERAGELLRFTLGADRSIRLGLLRFTLGADRSMRLGLLRFTLGADRSTRLGLLRSTLGADRSTRLGDDC